MATDNSLETKTEVSKGSVSPSMSSTVIDEKKIADEASPSLEAVDVPKKDVELTDAVEAEYPKGLSFTLIIVALFLCVFLTALDMVRLVSPRLALPLLIQRSLC